MATTAPTPVMLDVSVRWDRLIPTAIPSGINGDPAHYYDPGKHISRDDNIRLFGRSAWCVTLPQDQRGPGDKACAWDMNMSRADQNMVHNRLIQLYRNRATDPRAKYVHAFNGWNGVGQPMRYNLVNGATAVTDSSHTWHEHVETFYGYVSDPAMADAVISVISGESAAAYIQRTSPAVRPETTEDNVSQQVIPLPRAFAYDETETLIDREAAVSVPVEPAGLASNPVFGTKRLYLSLSADHTGDPGDKVKVRVAIHNGDGWTVNKILVPAGGREAVPVPAPKNGTAFNVTVGRMKTAAEVSDAEELCPLSVLVTVA